MKYWLPILLFLFASPAGAAITADIAVHAAAIDDCEGEVGDEICVAPLAVFFSARGTTCSDPSFECDDDAFDNEEFHKLHYEWTFGDPGSGTWDISGQNKNTEYGPIAAHVYESSGTYTVTLQVWSNSETDTETATIYVDDTGDIFDGKTVCVANGSTPVGGQDSCPSGAVGLNQNDFDNAVESSIAGGYRRILFKAGDTFTLNGTASISVDGPGIIGSYGTGKANIDSTACNTCNVFSPGQASIDHWRIMDLDVEYSPSTHYGDNGTLISHWGTYGNVFANILFYRLEVTDPVMFIMAAGGGTAYGWDAPPGVFVVECDYTGRRYGLYLSTQRGAILGTVGEAKRPDNGVGHPWRIGSAGRWEDMLIAHNETKGDNGRGTTIRGQEGGISQFLVVRENKFGDTVGQPWAEVSLRAQNPDSNERIRDVIFENNRFSTWLNANAKTLTIRNNLFVNSANPYSRIYISLNGNCAVPDDWFDDIMVYNNSAYRTGSDQDFIEITNNGCPGGDSILSDTHVFYNNVMWNTNSNAEVIDCASWCSTVNADYNTYNIDSDQMSSSPFASSTPDINTSSEWRLTGPSASVAIDAGSDLGSSVYDDFEHNVRVGGTYDIGAFDDQADEAAVSSLSTGITLQGITWQ